MHACAGTAPPAHTCPPSAAALMGLQRVRGRGAKHDDRGAYQPRRAPQLPMGPIYGPRARANTAATPEVDLTYLVCTAPPPRVVGDAHMNTCTQHPHTLHGCRAPGTLWLPSRAMGPRPLRRQARRPASRQEHGPGGHARMQARSRSLPASHSACSIATALRHIYGAHTYSSSVTAIQALGRLCARAR